MDLLLWCELAAFKFKMSCSEHKIQTIEIQATHVPQLESFQPNRPSSFILRNSKIRSGTRRRIYYKGRCRVCDALILTTVF